MKLYMKQQVFSWRDRFFVKDEMQADRYAVEGELFSWGKKLHVYDTSNREVAFIQQKVMSWMPHYFIEIEGRMVCEVVKEFTFFKQRFYLEGIPWMLEGEFWAHDYRLSEQGRTIMQLSKQWFTWGDSYEMDIPNPQHELLAVCVALTIDCIIAQQANN